VGCGLCIVGRGCLDNKVVGFTLSGLNSWAM
jgi:hypothetical protein